MTDETAGAFALFGGYGATAAGIHVGEGSAMKCPASRAAITLLCNLVGQVPFHCYRRTEDGNRERASDHPVERLLAGWCSPWRSSFEFRRDAMLRILADGRFAARIIRVDGKPVELHPLPHGSWSRDLDPASGEPSYKLHLQGGGTVTLPWSDILDVAALGDRSAIRDAGETIGAASVMEAHASRLFAGGGRPSGALKFKQRLSPEAAKRMKESWNAAHGGGNSGRTAVLEEDADFLQLALSSVDAQFQELRVFSVQEIARAFGVPPHMIFELGRATWSNLEEMGRAFVTYSLMPYLEIWKAAFERSLLTEDERETHFIEPTLDDLIRGNTSARFEAYAKATAGSGWLTQNEVRGFDNMAPLPDGDTLARPLNMGPAAPPPTSPEPAE